MSDRQSLNGLWKLKNPEWERELEADVPGSVMGQMLKERMIEDPYWRTNEYKVREQFRDDCEYRHVFSVSEQILSADEIRLVFEGIDTIGDIYLNGELLGKVKDMHRTWRFEVKSLLREENELRVYLHSPIAYIENKDKDSDITYSSTGSMPGNGWLRKAHYMFGWDWGPQLPDMGIWRDVYLEYSSVARLEDVRIRQYHGEDQVRVNLECPVKFFRDEDLEIQVNIEEPGGRSFTKTIPAGRDNRIDITIQDPMLWWPNGYGSQPLYQTQVFLKKGEEILDRKEYRIGLRTITVSTEKDQWGNEFAFVINGQKIFAMGANYIPEDSILSRLSEERSDRLIRDCAEANFNCIRIWGGGYYPPDYLYDACDRYGILVWQDLMFACNVYAVSYTHLTLPTILRV